ncbi:MAG TPA: DUF2795 domain-containing protein [Acidimicrobiia bacterium]|nr:DUF2795 domain-containing protein [Acidimicrobiia bacterium]
MAERGSTHHSPRVDEALHKESESLLRGSPVEARAEDWRRAEPPADGEPLPDARVTVDDVELRSLLAISLRPSAFPGDRAGLLAVAEEEHAEDRVLDWLGSLPATQTFPNVEAVWEALGGTKEQRETPPPPAPETPLVPEPVVPERAAEVRPLPVREPPGEVRSETDVRPEPDQSIVGRVRSLAMAGIEVAVGLVIEAVLQVRRRL